MHIDTIPNRNSPPAILLRESYREGGKVRKRTLANLSSLSPKIIDNLRLALKGVQLAPAGQTCAIKRSLGAGHVQAVLGMARQLGLEQMLAPRPCRERDLVLAMVVQRLLAPCSKLAMTRQWQTSILARELGIEEADEQELYGALDWLSERRERVEKALARRHLDEGSHVLYDVSSSTYHGHSCPIAARGYNRDKDGDLSIVYGLLTDRHGCPIAIEVYPGNTADPATVPDQVDKLRTRFGLERVVLVGDRGMLTQARIDALRAFPQLGWVSALRSQAIAALVHQGAIQMSLFDESNLAEIQSDAFPGERLLVCFNPLLADDRRRTRNELLDATDKLFQRLAASVARRTKTPLAADEIGVRAGKIIDRYKVGKHFILHIADGEFRYERNLESIARQEALDGIYVVRTSENARDLPAADTVRTYKSLGQVEQAFRCLKGVDIRIRPIHHRLPKRIGAHVFICMLAYYIEWHMRDKLAPVLFEDEDLKDDRQSRDPVAKATPSVRVQTKKQQRGTEAGWPVHSLSTLLDELATRTRNTCQFGQGKETVRVELDAEMTPFQKHVFELLDVTPKPPCTQ